MLVTQPDTSNQPLGLQTQHDTRAPANVVEQKWFVAMSRQFQVEDGAQLALKSHVDRLEKLPSRALVMNTFTASQTGSHSSSCTGAGGGCLEAGDEQRRIPKWRLFLLLPSYCLHRPECSQASGGQVLLSLPRCGCSSCLRQSVGRLCERKAKAG